MKTSSHIDKCMCIQCKNLENWYSIYSVNSKGRKVVNRVCINKIQAIEALNKLHDKGHFDMQLIEGKLMCEHRVSNKEIDYVIEKIMNKLYLFKSPLGINDGRKVFTPYTSLYDLGKQESISSSLHSQSERRTSVPCQRCDHGTHYVYLNRVYQRMVKRSIIDEYPKLDNDGYMEI